MQEMERYNYVLPYKIKLFKINNNNNIMYNF